MNVAGKHYRAVWLDGPQVWMIDQNRLPFYFEIRNAPTHVETARCIREMTVRGAGVIGAAGGFGMAQAFLEDEGREHVDRARETLESTRPTAQTLYYAVRRVHRRGVEAGPEAAAREAQAIADEEIGFCREIGRHAEPLIRDGMKILTHCNAGWLASVDYGSVTAPIYRAKERGKKVFVWVSETRPRAQGGRLTAWELRNEGVPHAVISDTVPASLMARGEVDVVMVGCDRVAANGDVANKVGTLDLAILAKEFGIPFYVAAPPSAMDFNCPSGEGIPIEERPQDEILYQAGLTDEGRVERIRVVSPGSGAFNPAFDMTPARYITGIITPEGVFKPGDFPRPR
ncbi:MAG: S-methyl-5-thioribose-1-phosphate isomerase [Planctomycetes bacterium]|nr:S-methyl-5-thioribose-1-phosphate isomerase [Planctomycetota bacterium]